MNGRRPGNQWSAIIWSTPRVLLYKAAEPRCLAARLNRYPGAIIGVAFQVAGRVVSVVWGHPTRPPPS